MRIRLSSLIAVAMAVAVSLWTATPRTLAPAHARAGGLPPPAGRLDRLAVDFAGRLGPALEGRRIPSLSVLAQLRLPPGHYSTGLHRLVRVATGLVATRLRALRFRKVTFAPAHMPAATVRRKGRTGGYALTLLMTLREAGGRLHLRGELWSSQLSLWGRLKGRQGRLLTHLHTSTPLDAELRSYLRRPTRPATVSCSGRWTPMGKQPLWGAALGDVDGDGRTELVLLERAHVRVLRWSTVYRRFDPVARVALGGARAATSPRFPLASLALADLDGDRRQDILARSSARAVGSIISFRGGAFTVRRQVDGYPVGAPRLRGRRRLAVLFPLSGRAELKGRSLTFQPAYSLPFKLPSVVHGVRFATTRSGVAPGRAASRSPSPSGSPAKARASARGSARRRAPRPPRPLVAVLDRRGRLAIRRVADGRLIHRVEGAGAAFALGDLTGDGRPEVITTDVKRFGSSDALVVRRLGTATPLCQVAGFEGSVTALATGDVRLDGRPRVVATVWNERKQRSYLLVVR